MLIQYYIFSQSIQENSFSDLDLDQTLHQNEQIVVDIEGLVCDFCARGLEKVFYKQKEIKRLEVDFDQSTLTIQMVPSRNLTDDDIVGLVEGNGFTVTKIRRF